MFVGGIIRDASGRWLCGFTLSFGMTPIFQVEARAMYKGLRLAWDRWHRRVELECDNCLLVETILAGGTIVSEMVELRLLHDLIVRPWVVHLQHIPRVQNMVVDALTRFVNPTMAHFNVMEEPPLSIRELLLKDVNLSG